MYYKIAMEIELPRQRNVGTKTEKKPKYFDDVEKQATKVHGLANDMEREVNYVNKKVQATYTKLYTMAQDNTWSNRQPKYIGTSWARLPASAQQNRQQELVVYRASVENLPFTEMSNMLAQYQFKLAWDTKQGLVEWVPDIQNVENEPKVIGRKKNTTTHDKTKTASRKVNLSMSTISDSTALYTNIILCMAQYFDEPLHSIVQNIIFHWKGPHYEATEPIYKQISKFVLLLKESVNDHFIKIEPLATT